VRGTNPADASVRRNTISAWPSCLAGEIIRLQMANQKMPLRTLGKTGEKVSAIGLGGWHLSLKSVDSKLADRIMRTAADNGMNFFDNSWDYNNGLSEKRMGRVLEDGYRAKVFLMTKINGRTKKEATRQLDQSLKRLRTEMIDLVQHHEVIRFEDPDRIFAEDGANAALVEARRQGKLRYIGFTGHKDPHIHLHMLQVAAANGFVFDTAQMPLNVMDAHFRSFSKMVVPELVKQKIAVLGMKSMANGHILRSQTVTPIECLHYALNLDTSVVITGIDSMAILEQAFEAARTFRPLSAEGLERILSKTRQAASKGEFELFKTSSIYDGTAAHPEWLGEEPARVLQVIQTA
jgi:predicted aldo/keto reductase-like oxidoreductase